MHAGPCPQEPPYLSLTSSPPLHTNFGQRRRSMHHENIAFIYIRLYSFMNSLLWRRPEVAHKVYLSHIAGPRQPSPNPHSRHNLNRPGVLIPGLIVGRQDLARTDIEPVRFEIHNPDKRMRLFQALNIWLHFLRILIIIMVRIFEFVYSSGQTLKISKSL
jgi:hypothetical protein